MANHELDYMEYSSDANAQAAYVTNAVNYDSYTKLLCHFDTAKATSVLAETGQTITFVGTADCQTTTKKWTGSLLLDGNSDYVRLANSADYAFGTGDWTIEFWIYPTAVDVLSNLYDSRPTSTNGLYPRIQILNTNKLTYYTNSDVRIMASTSVSLNTWQHIAVVRSGEETKLYLNGAQEGDTYADTNDYLTDKVCIGAEGYAEISQFFPGYIDEFRISKGIARWTADFSGSLPSAPYDVVLQSYSESTIKTQGSYALKAVAAQTDSLNKTLTHTFASPLDLSGVNTLKLDMRSTRTGANVKIGLHDTGGTTTELTPTINSADTYETKTWDISGVADADKNNITELIVTVVNADA